MSLNRSCCLNNEIGCKITLFACLSKYLKMVKCPFYTIIVVFQTVKILKCDYCTGRK